MAEKDNEQKTYFPFNSYDVFGYLIPGSVLFLIIYVFEFWATRSLGFAHKPFFTLYELFKPIKSENNGITTVESILFLLGAIIFIYILGHITASISSFFIDRVLIRKGHYYPIEAFLRGEGKNTKASQAVRSNFIMANFFLILYYLISIIFTFEFTRNRIYENSNIYHFLALLFIILGTFALIYTFSYELNFLSFKKPSKTYSDLISILKNIVGNGYDISEEIIEKYKFFLINELKLKDKNYTTDAYWMSYLYISRKSPSALKTLLNWMHLYSFARNLSTAFYIAFTYGIISIGINSHYISFDLEQLDEFKFIVGLLIPLIYFIISIIFLLRFYYLYHSYYSKFIIRACVSLYNQDKKDSI